ncbi:MAG: zinc ribbon domain-containing protein [Eubacteriales bacterium]|nr:zinc ribbon domain-containing protein [Eubacteriales bacterium]
MSKIVLKNAIIAKLSEIGITPIVDESSDLVVECEFLDAKWSTGKKKIEYHNSAYLNEDERVLYYWETTKETGSGLSFGGSSGSSFQSGKTILRKVKSIQYGADGKAYEYDLDLGQITKAYKETAKDNGWQFKVVLKKDKAEFPAGYHPAPTHIKTSTSIPATDYSKTDDFFYCPNCGTKLPAGRKFCQNCGAKTEASDVEKIFIPSEKPQKEKRQKINKEKKPKRKGCLIIFIIILILFIISLMMLSLDEEIEPTALDVNEREGVTVSILSGNLGAGDEIQIAEVREDVGLNTEDFEGTAYEISLPGDATLIGTAEITLPFDMNKLSDGISFQDGIAAAYYDETTQNWASIPYVVNDDDQTVTIYTNHFSRYAVVYYQDGRSGLSERLPQFDNLGPSPYSVEQLTSILSEMDQGISVGPTALDAGWSSFTSYYGLSGATADVLANLGDNTLIKSISEKMSHVGAAFAIVQLAMDVANGDNNAAVNHLIKNSVFYTGSTMAGNAIAIGAAGATIMDVALNQYAEEAFDKNLQKWQDAYWSYYTTDSKMQRTASDWYHIIENLQKASGSAEDFKAKLDQEVTIYCDKFWYDAEGYAYVAEKTEGIRGFGAGGEFTQEVTKLRDWLKSYVYTHTIKQTMERFAMNLWIQESIKADKALLEVKKQMNKEYSISVNLANYQNVENLSNTKVAFTNSEGEVIHSQSFDANGKATLEMSLLGFLKAKGPVNVTVSVPAQGNTPAYSTSLTYRLSGPSTALTANYIPQEQPPEDTEDVPTPTTPTAPPTQPPTTTPPTPPPTTTPPTTTTPTTTTPPPKEYDYQAALAAWSSDFAASQNAKTYDDGSCKTTCTFEWVLAPYIKDGQVYGASRLYYNDSYYAGPKAGTSAYYVASEVYDAANPGVFMTLNDLKKAYPNY